jgi:AcrR family transcriptional regulator
MFKTVKDEHGDAALAETALPCGPGRKRDEATRQAILRAAYETLAAEGYRCFTIEGVAERAGCAKTTIYRWWPSKGVLAIESFLPVFDAETPFPHTASAIQDLKTHLHLQAKALSGRDGKILLELVAAGLTDPAMRKLYHDRVVVPRREMGARMLRRGIAQGELRADMDIEAALDALYGPFYSRFLTGMGPCDETWVDRLCDTVLRGLVKENGASA